LEITKVELSFPNRVSTNFKCWAKIVINGSLLITGVRLFERRSRETGEIERYIRFPDRQLSLHATGGEYVSIAVVNTNDDAFRQYVTDTIFAEYDKHPRNPINVKKRYDRNNADTEEEVD
jgi:hypothetical protein